MNIISKEAFISALSELKYLDNVEKELNGVLKKLDPEFNFITFSAFHQLIIDVLTAAFQDKENGWISYWVYELDFGKKARKTSVTMKGKSVPIKTASDLYKILVDDLKDSYGKKEEGEVRHTKGKDSKK